MLKLLTIIHLPFVQTLAQLMNPICPLWAPIHQPLTHGKGLEGRDHLLLKCLNGWAAVGILIKAYFFSECSESAGRHLD